MVHMPSSIRVLSREILNEIQEVEILRMFFLQILGPLRTRFDFIQ